MNKRIILSIIAIGLLLSMSYQGIQAYLSPSNSQHIIVYTTKNCPYCKALRHLLEDYQIAYQDVDVEETLQGQMAYVFLGRPGVPITLVNEQIIYGYDGEIITNTLIDAGYNIAIKWEN